ncbi:DUF6940 family protein [Rhodohalobacter sp.]|uniref:DUF6940 family protein n=1 Tax=Rhodohalobacter sp. TaxID=1974210 RepID=UPI002ACD31AD|nr:hypothetical protein [Rhodohalobacter sp.]MDZ7756287.1 hypothetical protein [Rhodohalobacter sp.]
MELLKGNEEFRGWYDRRLQECPFEAFFWENRPMTRENLDEPYEYNLVESDFLARVSPDAQTFRSHFKPGREVVSFPNLGNDAELIAPCPVSDNSVYPHIGSFVRKAPESQIRQKFWKMVGSEMTHRIGAKPKWLSTSGLGVFWLHARIDSQPKVLSNQRIQEAVA